MRAVANDSELADIVGIKRNIVILEAFVLGSALASVGGILVALDTDLTPTMGVNALLLGMTASIVGGIGSLFGNLFGGILIGLIQSFSVWIVSTGWQDAIIFFALIVFLLFRPQGFLGRQPPMVGN